MLLSFIYLAFVFLLKLVVRSGRSIADAELRVAIVDQEPNVGERTGEAEVARLLPDPPPIRIRGAAGEVDAAGLKLDKEEHVVATQEGSLDRRTR